MILATRIFPRPRARSFALAALCAALTAGTACSHNNQSETDEDLRPDPIAVHVKNDNFLDMNVSVVTGSTTRRLGQVSGNSSAEFTVNWAVVNGSGLVLVAVPIGGSGSARSAALNVNPGQEVDFRIASVLRQSTAVVHDP